MRIGYITTYSEAEIEFAQQAGFKSLELLMGPENPLNCTETSEEELEQARARLEDADLEISAFGWYPNWLALGETELEKSSEYFTQLLELAAKWQVPAVCTFAGRNPELDIKENIPLFKEVWEPLAHKAEEVGVKIGFENCPMFHTYPFKGGNIAYTPYAWDLMFEAVPSEALGLEYDPSHMIVLEMDYLMLLREYGSKVVHVHAKDCERLPHVIARYGKFHFGAFRDRVPGLGEVDWGKVISTLHEVGYTGNVDIEGRHDPIFHGEREREGLVLGLRHLAQFVADEYVEKGGI